MSTTHLAMIAITAFLLAAAGTGAAEEPAYVGSEACGLCHQDLHAAFRGNPHFVLESDKRRGWQTKACESCHGPGGKHVESASAADILNPLKVRPTKANQTCLKCHLNEPTHVGRIQSGHARNTVACTACHTMHRGQAELVRRKFVLANQLCAECHQAQWAEFQGPYKHRLAEGAMSCVDCHNPHGSTLPKSLQATFANEQACLKCHSDLRGPFAFEHAPVRLGGCITCHEPHGSANPRMLKRHEQRFLCLECHANIGATKTLGGVPPGFHELRTSRFRNCTVCHTQIHGSFVDRALLK